MNEKMVEAMARLVCATYWQGKLENVIVDGSIEKVVEEKMNDHWQEWIVSVKVFASQYS